MGTFLEPKFDFEKLDLQSGGESCVGAVEVNSRLILQYIARLGSVDAVSRRVYPTKLVINGRALESVVIDPHYEEKHADSVSDEIILALVTLLDGKTFRPADVDDDGSQYFVNDQLEYEKRFYK